MTDTSASGMAPPRISASRSAGPNLARSDRSYLTEWRRTIDWGVMIAAIFLIAIGLLMSLAAGPSASEIYGYGELFFIGRQALFASAAVVILICTSVLDKVWARRFAAAIFIGAFALMAFILFNGHEAKGGQRWIRMYGFSLQPSEMIKPALIVLTGWLLAQRELYPRGPWAYISLLLFVSTLGLLILQPDVGQAALLTAAFVITFYISGMPWRWAAAFVAGGAALAGALYATLPHVQQRVNSFLDPSAYDTYQVDKAREAIQNGGLFGAGPGEGTVKASLPDAHTDFIFSVMIEEFGFVAALALIGLFVFIVMRGIQSAGRLNDPYPRAAAIGLFSLFGLQAAINIGVNVSLLPPKGMTLPFVSYGGSSMIGTALTIGLALALIRQRGARRANYGRR